MIALDTNMLVRALVADNPAQVEIVRRLMASNTVFISRTVLLETEWVLRSRYKKTRAQLQAFLSALLETDDLIVEAADAVSLAIGWYAQGADFADAMRRRKKRFSGFQKSDEVQNLCLFLHGQRLYFGRNDVSISHG